MSDPTEPTHDVNDRPCLILDLPELADEAAWQLSEFLQCLAEHIDAHYSAQILRAHRAHERERQRLNREQFRAEAQQPLPFPTRRSNSPPAPSSRSLSPLVHHRS